ncbi:MAG: hypothetical protein H7Y42_01255 [Chitinophagaceae bacterium]|nr:hypothetical protein [Chitinophagaceae bacterium]
MKEPTSTVSSLLYYRLIALWVLNEAMLGGIIHGLRIPVSGLVVGGCAVICICLIGWYVPVKGAILKATIIVAIFKMMLSPQAPPPAYIAVFFQGFLGELLFWKRRFFAVSCVLFATLSLLESGLQRILVLTILYGNDLWKVINDFLNGLTKQKTTTNYSLLIGGGYVLLHLVAGLLIGWWASGLPGRVGRWKEERVLYTLPESAREFETIAPTRKRKRWKWGLLLIWIILILLYAQSSLGPGAPLLPSYVALRVFIRSFIIILTWYFVVGPLVMRLLHRWLQEKKTKNKQDIERVIQLLPSTKSMIMQSWQLSGDRKGWSRLKRFLKSILINSLAPPAPSRVMILTGKIGEGKTTSLVNWSESRKDVFGVLTPVINGKRFFMDAHARHLFPMEASPGDKEVVTIGKYTFSTQAFERAIQLIRYSIQKPGWLIIDELGPLELKGEGFYEVVLEALRSGNESQRILLVVREGLLDDVKNKFNINGAVVGTRVEIIETITVE